MLYVIPTPIGNKDDITIRALNLFKNLEIFLSEDTRTTKNLMKLYGIDYSTKQFYSFTSFTSQSKINYYINLIKENDVGVVSEAGTPGLSDPGKELIKYAWENNISFEVLPGANALVPAVVSACFDTSNFIFLGFLPTKKGRQDKIKLIISSQIPVFVYESVHRFEKLLLEMKNNGFNGKVFVARELSKMFEQKICDSIDNVLEMLKSGEIKAKGEFVVGFYSLK